MVKKMHTQKNKCRLNIVESFSQEFNGHDFYGLEFILDELYDETENNLQKKNTAKVDWFGLTDLIV